jgi:N-acetylmuramic acid 6-phosphate etherase
MNAKQAPALERLTTEAANPASTAIDSLSALEIVRLMNAEDAKVASAVGAVADSIAAAINAIVDRLRAGGRLIYLGAGTSGRLGVLDASECPPTFSTPPELVVGLIAGGRDALTRAIEGAEDHPEDGERDLRQADVSAKDVVVGIATSGRTPYVIGGLTYARAVGAFTVGLCCNADSELESVSDVLITPVVGPEVISGSTRLKAGTATKMVLNMLTTGAMVRLGKTFGNVMVDLRATNSKLKARSRRIVSQLADVDAETADRLLLECAGEVKTAIVVQRRGVSPETARRLLSAADGHLRRALDAPEPT